MDSFSPSFTKFLHDDEYHMIVVLLEAFRHNQGSAVGLDEAAGTFNILEQLGLHLAFKD